MTRRLHLAALLMAIMATLPSMGQRYLEEIFTETQVEADVTFGVNVSFILSDVSDPNAFVGDVGNMQDFLNNGETIPTNYFIPNPALPVEDQTVAKATLLDMDIYSPPATDTETARPVAIVLHTGNFLPPLFNNSPLGSKSDSVVVNICKDLARRGYVAAAVDYRLGWNPLGDENTKRGTLLQAVYRALQDTQTAVRYLKANSTDLGIDPEKVFLVGQGSGGYVAQAYITLNDYNSEVAGLAKFIDTDTGFPYVIEALHGDIDGGPGAVRLTDPLHTAGIDKTVQMAVNLGGALADSSWVDAGEAPMVTFQCVRDAAAPFDRGTVVINVGLGNQNVVDVDGGNVFIRKANEFGNNDVFAGLPDGDVFTDAARAKYGQTYDYIFASEPTLTVSENAEGLYPILRPITTTGDFLNNESNPWDWWDLPTLEAVVAGTNAATGQSFDAQAIHDGEVLAHPGMSATQGMAYLDTIQGYMIPRITCVLGLPGNPCEVAGPCPEEALNIYDTFENYDLGAIDTQSEHWAPWSAGGAVSSVSNEHSFSTDQSLFIGPGGAEDNILQLGDQTTGEWNLNFMAYIPAGATGYFNIQNEEVPGVQWNLDVFFNEDGSTPGMGAVNQSGNTFAFPEDTWFPVNLSIDLNADVLNMDINQVAVEVGTVYEDNIGAVNFYSSNATNAMYIDELTFYCGDNNPVGIQEYVESNFSIYPNPTEGVITIAGEEQIDAVIVRDVLGAIVRQINTPMSNMVTVNIADLSNGVYFVEVQVGDIINVSRVSKQ